MMRTALKEATLTALIALLLLGPIMSLVLADYRLEFLWQRSLYLVLMVFSGKFLWVILQQNQSIKNFMTQRKNLLPKAPIKFKYKNKFLTILIIGSILPFCLEEYWLSVFIFALIYILLGLGLNIVVGLAGLLNLGFAAFYAMGAYTFALGAHYWHLGFWSALPLGAGMAALLGILLAFPVLRMYGDYLAIVTLGFGEIFRLILNNWSDFTNGPNGLSVPAPTFLGLEFAAQPEQGGKPFHVVFNLPFEASYRYLFLYFIIFATVLAMFYLVSRLQKMPLGRAWEALREDEIACRCVGINPVTTKLSAFCLGALLAGIAGVFFAALTGFVDPASFGFTESALILCIVVLGGMGSPLGVILAALLLTLLPEILREFSEYRMLIFGLLLIIMMVWRPQGLVRLTRQSFKRLP